MDFGLVMVHSSYSCMKPTQSYTFEALLMNSATLRVMMDYATIHACLVAYPKGIPA